MRLLPCPVAQLDPCVTSLADEGRVGPVPESLRQARNLDPFYQKHLSVNGFSILGSAKVSDAGTPGGGVDSPAHAAGRDDILQALDQRACT